MYSWKEQPPVSPTIFYSYKRLKYFANQRYLPFKFITVPRKELWKYLEFLYTELKTPRNKIEKILYHYYRYCFQQSIALGVTGDDWIDYGIDKHAFVKNNKVIKIFIKPDAYYREFELYQSLVYQHRPYILPHEYHEHYCVCDWIDTDPANFSTVKNREYIKQLSKKKKKSVDYRNWGVYKDNLVLFDIEDADQICYK